MGFTDGFLTLTGVLVGACWLPVVWLQIKIHRPAASAEQAGPGLPTGYFANQALAFEH